MPHLVEENLLVDSLRIAHGRQSQGNRQSHLGFFTPKKTRLKLSLTHYACNNDEI